MKLTKLTDLIPVIEANPHLTMTEIGKMFKPKIAYSTMASYCKQLREAGHNLPKRKPGKPKLQI